MDEDKLMDACDIIDVITPPIIILRPACRAIRKGKHVFVEKPLANTIQEGRDLVNMAREANIKMQVGHVERFNPAFLALKDLNLNPMFIEVHRLAQFNPRGTEVSVILDLMIHDIDIILSLVKSGVKHISASGVAVMTDTPDIANVRIEFNNGCVANLTSSRISMKKMRKMRLFQPNSYIGIDFLEKKTEIIKLKQPEDTNVFSFDIDTQNGKKTIAIANPTIEPHNAIKLELEAFVAAIQNNTPTIVSEIDGFLAMEVAHQILEKSTAPAYWYNGMPSTIRNSTMYAISDYCFSIVSWYFLIQWTQGEGHRMDLFGRSDLDPVLVALMIPCFWTLLYLLSGTYQKSIYQKSRLNELTDTLIHTSLGILLLGLIGYRSFLPQTLSAYLLIQFGCIFLGRAILLEKAKFDIIHQKIFSIPFLSGIIQVR